LGGSWKVGAAWWR